MVTGGDYIIYNRAKAVEYAHHWALKRNPKYYNFDSIGGDCTNFASQCIYAGSGIMNYTPVLGWFYITSSNRTASWTGVEYLYNFLINNKGAGPYAKEVGFKDISPGDIVQLSFDGKKFAHSPVIVKTGTIPNPSNILISAHSYDCDNRRLDSYSWEKIRCLHIEGVRK